MPGSRPASFFVVLGFVQAIWPLTMDLYLPAFPQISEEFGASPSLVQFTLTGAFIGMAIGQLLAGPLSDRVGRMRPFVIVLVLYTGATVLCALAPTIEMLIALRFVQGIGAAASAVITLAIVRDSAEGARMVQLLARLQLVNGVFVVASPAIGAQLLHLFDWRGLFWILVGYGSLLLIAALTVLLRHETNPPAARALRGGASVIDDYRVLFSDSRFLATMAVGALLWAAMMSYMASSAFLFQDVFGLDPTGYALIFGGHGALMILGAQVSARLAVRHGVDDILRRGSVVIASVAAALLLSVTLAPGWGLLGFVIPLFVFTTTFGVISPAIQSSALSRHGLRAGTAASLLGATNMISGAIAAPLVGLFGVGTPVPAVIIMCVCSAAGALVAVLVFRPRLPVRSSASHQ